MAKYSTIGKIVLASALAIFAYFTFWISILPFIRIEIGMLNDGEKNQTMQYIFVSLSKYTVYVAYTVRIENH